MRDDMISQLIARVKDIERQLHDLQRAEASGGGAVDSVNGATGVVVLDSDDIDEGATNLYFTTAEETKLAGIEASADVTDAGNVGSSIHGATAKTTPVDADTMPLIDSAASNVLKKVTWANIKAALADIGTWTPVIADATSGGNTGTATTTIGRYKRNRIDGTANLELVLLGIDTTGMTGANVLTIRGLPFTSSSTANTRAIGAMRIGNVTFSGFVTASIPAGVDYMQFNEYTSGGATGALTVSDLSSGSAQIYVSITYFVD